MLEVARKGLDDLGFRFNDMSMLQKPFETVQCERGFLQRALIQELVYRFRFHDLLERKVSFTRKFSKVLQHAVMAFDGAR